MKASLLLSLGLLLAILASPSTTAEDENQNSEGGQADNNLTGTTKAPETSGNSTTEAPKISGNSTTEAPETSGNSTTEAPETSGNSTTEAPETSGNSTTVAPETSGNSTTEAPETSGNSTTEAPETSGNSTTKAPDLPGNSTEPTKTPNPAGPQDPCKPNPCGGSASCVNLNTEWFCVCPEGYYYQNATASCEKGKTFPGEIGVKMTETTGLDNKTSPAYQDLYNKVVKFFENALNKTDYGFGQTIIIKVSFSASPSQSARSAMHATDEFVNVSVVNMFDEKTSLNESTISEAIERAFENDPDMRNYTGKHLCDHYGCDNNDDGCRNPLQCTCKPGLTRPSPQNPFCLPLECSRSCSAEEKKQCLKNGDGPLTCLCMPGYQRSTDDKCEACPFGYSGQDCKDPFQLILTIVGTIAGALILILLIAFIVSVSSKNKKKNVEEQKLIDEDFQNVRMQQTGFSNSGFSNSRFSNSGFSNNSDFSNIGAGNSIFPKVKTQNPYANQRSMPRPDY